MSGYSEYRVTSVPWLLQIPNHWSEQRGGNLFTRLHRPIQESHEVVTCFRDGTVTLRKNRRTTGFTEAFKEIGYQGVDQGDLVIHAMDAFAGAVGVSDSQGKSSPVYAVCSSIGDADPYYFARIVREMARSGWILALAKGIRERSTDFRFETFATQILPVPPLDEQQAIARFLDRQDRRINRFIRAKRRMVELLNEQKQAIIHQAVTRGLDPDVPLKPSGIDWLGDIPAHWQPTPLKTVAKVQTGITIGKDYGRAEVGEYPYLRVANVQAGHLNLGEIKTILVPQFEASRSMLQDGDVLMTEGGDIDKLGRGAVWRAAINPCLHQNHVFAVRPVKHMISPEYLVLVMSSRIGRIYFETTAKKTTNLASTNSTTLKSFLIPLPTIQEQSVIREELSKSIAHIDSAVFRASREIDLIREYRTRLITDVVTGKLDVRNHPDAQERVVDEGDDDSILIEDAVDDLIDEAELEEDDDAVAD